MDEIDDDMLWDGNEKYENASNECEEDENTECEGGDDTN